MELGLPGVLGALNDVELVARDQRDGKYPGHDEAYEGRHDWPVQDERQRRDHLRATQSDSSTHAMFLAMASAMRLLTRRPHQPAEGDERGYGNKGGGEEVDENGTFGSVRRPSRPEHPSA